MAEVVLPWESAGLCDACVSRWAPCGFYGLKMYGSLCLCLYMVCGRTWEYTLQICSNI